MLVMMCGWQTTEEIGDPGNTCTWKQTPKNSGPSAFAAFATNPQLAEKIKINFALAPIATAKYVTSVLRFTCYIDPQLFKMANKGTCQAYDWGSPSLNILHHNQLTPPLYHVEDVRVPTAMWSGGRDILVDPIDIKNLEPRVSNLIYHKKIPSYNHLDFMLGLDVYDQIDTEIIMMMNEAQ
uniref:Uncharacterized protein n=1 Tax=Equus asinus TaxID=9793 RepID=A0A9L0IA14_EQUAS